MTNSRTMRVRDLIERLQQFPADEFVWSEDKMPILDVQWVTGGPQNQVPLVKLVSDYRPTQECPCGNWSAS